MAQFRLRLASLGLAAAGALSLLSLQAQAAPVTRHFEFSSTSGALQFGPNIGSFTYDDAVAPVGGGFVGQLNLFSDLDVSFGGFSFTEANANSGWLSFNAAGELQEAHFGNNCYAGGCSITWGAGHWWIRIGPDGVAVNDFAYSGFNGETNFRSTALNRLLPEGTVPEPASLALAASALLAAVGAGRRRKN